MGGGTRRGSDAGVMVPAKAASGGGNFGTQRGAPDDAKAMHGAAAELNRGRRRVGKRGCLSTQDRTR